MNFVNALFAAGISLLLLALIFIPMEKAFPAKKGQKVFRQKWLLDLSYFAGQYLIWNSWVLKGIDLIDSGLISQFNLPIRETIKGQSLWVQALEVFVLSDFLIYWGHRLQHRLDFLWRFHKVHHSAESLDWLAAHREHPLDSVYTICIINLPAMFLGFDLDALAMLVVFRGIWAVYIHSNVRLNLGPLKKLIGSPEIHHWHHDKERDRGNYANLSPLMDILFGTYVCPPQEPEQLGIKEPFPQTYLAQLLQPMLTQKVAKRLFKIHESQQKLPDE